MGKLLLVLLVIAIGVGAWVTVDPGARPAIAGAWNSITAATGEIDAASLWAPIGRAFQNFADSVAHMWSPSSIRISVPSVQVKP